MSKTDWSKPAAMAIPKSGYFQEEKGRYGPLFPRTPALAGHCGKARAVASGLSGQSHSYGADVSRAAFFSASFVGGPFVRVGGLSS